MYMRQPIENETEISVACLCLFEEDLQLLLSAMSIETIRNMIHYLNAVPALTRFDCEASLIDFLDLIINNNQTRETKETHIENFLYATLSDQEATNIIQAVSMDTQKASKLIFSMQRGFLGAKDVSHALGIISGIKQRLFDTSDPYDTLEFDHFTTEMILKAGQYIQQDPDKIASLLEFHVCDSVNHYVKKYIPASGRKRTVITLLQFDILTISRLFENLATIEKQAIVFEMKGLGQITKYDTQQAMIAYMELMLSLKLVDSKQIEEVHNLLTDIKSPTQSVIEENEIHDGNFNWVTNGLSNHQKPGLIEELIKIAQFIIIKNPRLVARAIRHMFRQEGANGW